MFMTRRRALALIGASASPAFGAGTAPGMSFGVVPQAPPAQLAEKWEPLLTWLSARSGVPLRFETAKDIPSFEARLADSAYDLAFMNPYHYTVYHRRPGYEAFAHEADRQLQGVLVVARSSPLRRLADLDGHILAFPSPASFAATLLPLAAIENAGLHVSPQFVKSHLSVYLAVAAGLYPAGGGVVGTLEQAPGDVRARLQVMWTSAPFTPHAFASHPRVPKAELLLVRQAMVDAARDPVGRALFKAVGMSGVVAASDASWGDVRALPLARIAPMLMQ